ncbi:MULTISPECIES: GntR family transcriptional regulator [unclassified Yoonia]|uniref:GntR family transcriptional regulator n=1 Tax=unclassified Yoonia TaxID=2629118 RepID=UPI002AFF1DA0|nr:MULTISPECIES: GntR family transcriptional regulator [unclassified Yoonia]
MSDLLSLPALQAQAPRNVADQIFDLLHERIINLSLEPGAKLSEAEVATQLGVSRQPVRDAFYRLSQLGFIVIRPQRATQVTHISREATLQAYFVRRALEEATMRRAALDLTTGQLAALAGLIEAQAAAIKAEDKALLHKLDDQFHHDICDYAGLGFVWTLIRDNKGHMDRARYLSLSFNAPRVVEDHTEILAALRARDPEKAASAAGQHLGRITTIIAKIESERPEVFGPSR